MMPRMLDDSDALNKITAILSVESWSPDTIDEIAQVVRATGRQITDDPTPAFPYWCTSCEMAWQDAEDLSHHLVHTHGQR